MDRRVRLALARPGRSRASPSARPTRPPRLSGSSRSTLSAAPQRGGRVAQQQVLAPDQAPVGARVRAGAARSKSSIACRQSAAGHGGIVERCESEARAADRVVARERDEPGDQQHRDERDQHARDEARDGPASLSGTLPRGQYGGRAADTATRCPGVSLAADARAWPCSSPPPCCSWAPRCSPSSPAATSTGRARPPPRSPGRSCCCSRSPARCRSRAAAPAGSRSPAWPGSPPGARSRSPGRRCSARRSTAFSACCSTSPRCSPRSPLLRDPRAGPRGRAGAGARAPWS